MNVETRKSQTANNKEYVIAVTTVRHIPITDSSDFVAEIKHNWKPEFANLFDKSYGLSKREQATVFSDLTEAKRAASQVRKSLKSKYGWCKTAIFVA